LSLDILQRFLDRRLLDIGADDTRLEKIRKAANDTASFLLRERSEAVHYALVAFDPDIPVNEPVLGDVGKALATHWNTYLSCFPDTPRMLLRGVILEALRLTSEEDEGIAVAVALEARNVLPFYSVSSEREVWQDLVLTAANRAEDLGARDWSSDFKVEIPQLDVTEAKASAGGASKLDRGQLGGALRAASGPGVSDSNPNWPNAPQQWAPEFSSRASNAIADAVDKALQENSKLWATANEDFTKSFAANFAQVASALQKGLTHVIGSAEGLRRRANLLWWKEASYSSSAKQSYRSFPSTMAALIMAIDLHREVPKFCPESVEHFLSEAVRTQVGTGGATKGRVPLNAIVDGLAKGNLPPVIRDELARLRQGGGRKPLVAFVADAVAAGGANGDRFLAEVGVKGDTPIELADFAAWVFRDLQAIGALAATGAEAARKASK
jgi:hypothetical protein